MAIVEASQYAEILEPFEFTTEIVKAKMSALTIRLTEWTSLREIFFEMCCRLVNKTGVVEGHRFAVTERGCIVLDLALQCEGGEEAPVVLINMIWTESLIAAALKPRFDRVVVSACEYSLMLVPKLKSMCDDAIKAIVDRIDHHELTDPSTAVAIVEAVVNAVAGAES